MKHKKSIVFALWLFLLLAISPVLAQDKNDGEHILKSPVRAIVSPHKAHLVVREKIQAHKNGEFSFVHITVPQDASNLSIQIPGHSIVRWNSSPVILKNSSQHMTKRAELVSQRNRVAANLAAVKARIEVWKSQTQAASSQELSNRQSLMQEQLPKLEEEQARFEETLNNILNELAEMPANSGLGKNIEVVFHESRHDGEVQVEYSYDVNSCGWVPVYHFNAKMNTGKENLIDVRLMADVWQYSGIDWTETEITLATRGDGPREPDPLRQWHVSSDEEKPAAKPPAQQPKLRGAQAVTMSARAEDAHAEAQPRANVVANTENIYASWELTSKGLPEGRSRMLINEDQWSTPLKWLCRPSVSNNNVWIMANYTLPPDSAWPAGLAQYSLEGQNIGEGEFTPKGNRAILYFGSDPRLMVNTVVNSDKQGETGIINTSKTWTGAWTFTLTNSHDVPIKVRVERPAPIPGNDNITITYKDNPKSQIDNSQHMIYWDVEVPAHGSSTIEQGITISSPVKLPLLPDVP